MRLCSLIFRPCPALKPGDLIPGPTHSSPSLVVWIASDGKLGGAWEQAGRGLGTSWAGPGHKLVVVCLVFGRWIKVLLYHSLVPRLPHSGTRTLKLCRRGELRIFCHVKTTKGREDLIVHGHTDTQNRKKSEGSGQLSTHIYLSGVE